MNDKEISKTNEISIKGSLGILAYGDLSIREWRKIRQAHLKNLKNDKK